MRIDACEIDFFLERVFRSIGDNCQFVRFCETVFQFFLFFCLNRPTKHGHSFLARFPVAFQSFCSFSCFSLVSFLIFYVILLFHLLCSWYLSVSFSLSFSSTCLYLCTILYISYIYIFLMYFVICFVTFFTRICSEI